MHDYDLIVVGGGASGLLAAGRAAEFGIRVLIVEKMSYPGRKLGITGKGRCNLTNIASMSEFIARVKPNGKFLRPAFASFFNEDLINFMNKIGVQTVKERGGRVFTESGKAVEVVKAMVQWCKTNGVHFKTNARVTELLIHKQQIEAVKINVGSTSEVLKAPNIIIACGGKSYPATGSTGDGYRLAVSAGHQVTQLTPSLVSLEIQHPHSKLLEGLELKNIGAGLWSSDKKLSYEFGEMNFTKTGISGPVILTLSRMAVPLLLAKNKISVHIDLKPALDHSRLDQRLLRELNSKGKNKLEDILKTLLPKQLIPVCIAENGLDTGKKGNQISALERKKIRNWLKNFKIDITGYGPWKEAIVTAGGVELNELDKKSMESKHVKGLYFVGEVLDLDGPTGGYNLQIAFSTAWLAAGHIGSTSTINEKNLISNI